MTVRADREQVPEELLLFFKSDAPDRDSERFWQQLAEWFKDEDESWVARWERFIFPADSDFTGATFSGVAWFEGAGFSGDVSFYGATFLGDARFEGATFSGNTLFFESTFSGEARFEGATFTREASFGGAIFSKDSRFDVANFLGGMRFEGVNFAGDASFNGGTFAEAEFELATFSVGLSFSRATFSGWTRFRRATFSGDAQFEGATFSGQALFEDAAFSGGALFVRATFSEGARFSGATFSQVALFDRATFSEEAFFHGATFSGDALFENAVFARHVVFDSATFCGDVRFLGADFAGVVQFNRVSISGDAEFSYATLSWIRFERVCISGVAMFDRVHISERAMFENATLSRGARFTGATVSRLMIRACQFGAALVFGIEVSGNGWVEIDGVRSLTDSGSAGPADMTFGTMSLQNVSLRNLDPSNIRFRDARDIDGLSLASDVRWPGEEKSRPIVADEKDLPVDSPRPIAASEVERIYRALRRNFESQSDRVRAHGWYRAEMEVGRKHSPWRLRKIARWLYWKTSDYGLSAIRPLLCLAGTLAVAIALFAAPWAASCVKVASAGHACGSSLQASEVALRALFQQPPPAGVELRGLLVATVWLLVRVISAAMLLFLGIAFRNQVAR